MIDNFQGWTINDVLKTDRETLMKIMLMSTNQKQEKQKITPLHEFIKNG